MENFDKFWYLLPKKDADVYYELRNYLENPGCDTDIARLFKTSTHRYILANLLEHPYPMCQIVRCLPQPIYMQLYYEALLQFAEYTPEQMNASKFNLYSFLINAHVSDKWLEKCQKHVFNAIFQRIDTDEYYELPLVLLSSKFMPLIKAYNTFVNHCYEANPYTKRTAFFIASKRSTHFFEPIIYDNHEINEPDFLHNTSKLVRLAMLISNKPIRPSGDFNFYDEVWKLFEQIDSAALSDNQKVLFNEFARMLSLHHFVRSNRRYENLSDSIAIKVLASKYNILDFFVKFNEGIMIMSTSDYHLVRRQLVENGIFNRSINPEIAKDGKKASEVNIYDQFYTINTMISLILLQTTTRNYEEIVRAKCGEIKQIIDNIDEPFDYIETIEYLFCLLFLRFEHVNLRVISNGKLVHTSTSISTLHDSESSMDDTKNTAAPSNVKNGFACTFIVMQNVLNGLSASIINRTITADMAEELKQRFVRMTNAIDDAKWRLQLVDLYYSMKNYLRAPSELKLMLTSRHKQMNSKATIISSTDEDDVVVAVPKKQTSVRKRTRRHNSGKKSSKSSKSSRSDNFANSTEIEGKERKTDAPFDCGNIPAIRYANYREKRGFMGKMLGQLIDMVTILITRGDLNAAKTIIEANDLSDSSIAVELKLLQNYLDIKSSLKESAKTIPQAPIKNMDYVYSMREIKNLVVAGFESSQILDVLEQFVSQHPICESDESRTIVDRFVPNYSYLDLYKGLALQGVVIVDLALSLVSNPNISSRIVNMLSKFWDKNEPVEMFKNRIGYLGFIHEIHAILMLFNNSHDQSMCIQELLSTQLYTIRESDAKQKLEQENLFIKQKQLTLEALSTRTNLMQSIIDFGMFNPKNENLLQLVYGYTMNMNRLIHFKHPFEMDINRTCLEEILEIDLFSLIGDIMFDEDANASLREIEAIVCNLNTNLMHVITKNTCPNISIYNKFSLNLDDELNVMLKTLLNKEDEKDKKLNEDDQSTDTLRKPFKIKRHDILYYVRQHNELIAYILGKMHGIEPIEPLKQPKMHLNYKLLNNMMEMEELDIRIDRYAECDDRMLAALSFDAFQLDLIKDLIEQKEYRLAHRLLQFCQERHLKRHKQAIWNIKDVLITKILEAEEEENGLDSKTYSLIEHIKDLKLMARTLLKHINRISDDELARHLIQTILLHNRVNEVPADQIEQLKNYMCDIVLYASIGRAITMTDYIYEAWTKVVEISRVAPERLLYSLIERNQYELCYQWIQTVSLQETVIKSRFIDLFMTKITDNHDNNDEYFIKVAEILLKKIMAIHMDSNILLKLRNRKLLQYLIDYLIENSKDGNEYVYKNYKITLIIFDTIDAKEANTLWHLIDVPLLIIEQYILNSKFETLAKIIKAIRPHIKSNECQFCGTSTKVSLTQESSENTQQHNHSTDDCDLECSSPFNYRNHATSVQCVDKILQTYAAKSLDFRIGSGTDDLNIAPESTVASSAVSMESLCGTFQMPREAPDKAHWIKDHEATHCMCCKKSIFTMLTRRHHCRRCGRVVCHSCSTKRLTIPKLYENILVRVCNDCADQTEEAQRANTEIITSASTAQLPPPPLSVEASVILEENEQRISTRDGWVYRFTGHLKHDHLLREEFSFEYAPSAALCINLISLHTPGQDCCEFLLNYCKKFEALLKPLKPGQSNPEVDYAFVTRILYCLSFAAKMYGGSSDCMKIRDHAEIINSVVRNGCESLLPMDTINIKSLRTLRDNLVVAEKFELAIELAMKSGLEKTGIMAAWGIACIKAGCFETAREKLIHCLIPTTCDEDRRQIMHFLTTDEQTAKSNQKPLHFKSTARSPKVQPLLNEILAILESTCHPVSSDTIFRSSTFSQSTRSLLSLKFTKKEKYPAHEPAVNILHTLSNLKQISQGKYSVKTHRTLSLTGTEDMNSLFASDSEQHGLHSRFYTESVYYLASYGRHSDVLRFLIKYKQVTKALKYSLYLVIPADQFIQTIIIPHLKSGRLNVIINLMGEMDETFMMWKDYIIQICLMLEKRSLLNSLYQVQLLLKDTIRASMTCVRFYTVNCVAYQDLRNNAHHLLNAQQHLKTELELCQWEEIKTQNKRPDEHQSLVMKMDSKSLNQHINTICSQIEASKFLAQCEENGKETVSLIPKISLLPCTRIPTLFENVQDKIILVALILICGTNVEEGFGLAYRIIQEMGLNCDKIYAIVTKYLATNNRLHDVEKLVNCIRGNSSQADTKLCNDILSLAVQSAVSISQRTKAAIENLIRLISDVAVQIDCHILSGQLKAAYLLAVQHKRVADIRRILRYAEKTNQIQIKKLCEKKLQAIDAQEDQSSQQ